MADRSVNLPSPAETRLKPIPHRPDILKYGFTATLEIYSLALKINFGSIDKFTQEPAYE